MAIERVNFDSIGAGGDNPTGALVKLDANCADLDTRATTNANSALAAATAANNAQSSANAALLAQASSGTFRNKLINGDFDFWQRGTAFAAGIGGYFADRWHGAAVGSTIACSMQSFVSGDAAQPPGHGDRFLRLGVVSVAGANNYAIFRQFIEGVSRFSNKVIGVSFWMRTAAGVKLGVDLGTFNVTGPGSGYLASQVITATNAGWNQYKLYFTTNDLTGATVAANNALLLRFTLDAGASSGAAPGVGQQSIASMDFSQVQLEVLPSLAAIHTPFEVRPLAVEFSMCARYALKLINPASSFNIFGLGYVNSATTANVYIALSAAMRVTPTPSKFGNMALVDNGVFYIVSSVALSSISSSHIVLLVTSSSGLGVTHVCELAANNDTTAYILLDADF
jgi:hypothetical protein